MVAIDLSGKRAVVTGGSRGVGRACALLLARAGADVAISYRSRQEDAARVVEQVEALGRAAFAHAADLASGAETDALFARVEQEFGSIDIFVGNAGIWEPAHAALGEMTDAQWHRTIAVNLDSIFFSTRAALRLMNDGGRVVLISSTAGQRGEAGHGDYAASKGAIISLIKGLCIELAPRQITANVVAPGWIDTEMADLPYRDGGRERIEAGIPIGRVASATDVAAPVAFLCSPLARHITGEVLNVNGGSVLCG